MHQKPCLLATLHYNSQELTNDLNSFQLQGRQLPPENIIMGGKNNIRSAGLKADFTQFATNNPVVLGVSTLA